MKRNVLFLLGLLISITTYAQQRNLSAVKQVFPRPVVSSPDLGQDQQGSATAGDVIYNRSGDLLKTDVSSSANLFGIFTTDQRVVSARPEANMVVFGNRAGGSFGATGNDLRIAYSTNLGTDFSNFIVSPDAGSGYMFRYPSVVVYNPEGNTDPANMFVIYSGPFTDAAGWKGQYYGSARLDGTDVHTTFTDNEPTVYINHTNIGLTANQGGDIHVASSRLNGTSAAYTFDGFEVLNGTFNAEDGLVDWETDRVKVQPDLLEDGRIDAPRMVFSPDGSVGYLICTAIDADNVYNPYGVEWPVIYKTTDMGMNWDKIDAFDFSEINTFYEYLWPTRADLDKVIPRWYNKWASEENQLNNGVTVDVNGNLHIAGMVRSTMSIHPDSLNYFYSEEPLLYFDVFMNGDGTWNAQFIDSVRSDILQDYLTVDMDQRLSMSRTPDGTKVFATWADTDPTMWGGGITTNLQPDVYIWGYDVTTQHYTDPVNVTAFSDYWGDNFWMHSTDYVIPEGTHYRIAVSTSINGATESDPVAHQYLNGVWLDEADFVNVGSSAVAPPVTSLQVSQNFPNPFNGQSRIDINLAENSVVSVQVCNLLGQTVYATQPQSLSSGSHSLYLNAAGLNAGLYTYTVIANGEKVTRKMLVNE